MVVCFMRTCGTFFNSISCFMFVCLFFLILCQFLHCKCLYFRSFNAHRYIQYSCSNGSDWPVLAHAQQ